mmetsp:Transcript_65230/g.98403  ORF Transcript_65230/g.98403 Transcript_65230/m.98403 type:complete len:147 (+) Transcript_65230:2-442(+)
MMYLVDLDDTPGYTLTVMKEPTKTHQNKTTQSTFLDRPQKAEASDGEPHNLCELSIEAQRILDEARAKLELLAMTKAGLRPSKIAPLVGSTGSSTEDSKPAANTDSESDEEHPRKQSKTYLGAESKHVFDSTGETGVEVCESMAEF